MGAPYWVSSRRFERQSLQNIIENVRLQQTWCGDVEIFCEADSYPRARNQVPAAYIECFESALRIDGLGGSLKYLIDYYAPPRYETGYTDRHVRNLPVTEALEHIFKNKQPAGIRVYEYMNEIENKDYPEKFIGEAELMSRIFKRSQTILSNNAIPTKYDGNGVGICFGESAKYIDAAAAHDGLILDISAAKILKERGFDVGFSEAVPCIGAKTERCGGIDYYTVEPYVEYYRVELKENSKVKSFFTNDFDCFPALFTYTGKDGCRFAVLTFNAESVPHNSNLLTSYLRQKQLADCHYYLCGKPLPAIAPQNPGMYLLCRKDGASVSVALWNIHEDIALSPKILLDEKFDCIDFINCSGRLKGSEVILSDIPPYSFCGFEARKA